MTHIDNPNLKELTDFIDRQNIPTEEAVMFEYPIDDNNISSIKYNPETEVFYHYYIDQESGEEEFIEFDKENPPKEIDIDDFNKFLSFLENNFNYFNNE